MPRALTSRALAVGTVLAGLPSIGCGPEAPVEGALGLTNVRVVTMDGFEVIEDG